MESPNLTPAISQPSITDGPHVTLSSSMHVDVIDHVVRRCTAARLVIVGPEEWSRGAVRVKDLESRTEDDVLVADLC